MSEQPHDDEPKDILSEKLEHAVGVVGDLLKVYHAYGERGPAAVFAHTEQLDDEQLRHVVTAFVSYVAVSNTAAAEMFTSPHDDGPTLN